MRQYIRHIINRLDIFLVQSSFLESNYSTTSNIVPWEASDHRPSFLQLKEIYDYGPIPFSFNPLWLQNKSSFHITQKSWSVYIVGSPIYIWEKKLKATKKELKEWAKPFSP
jgi:hypothetical protein